MSESSTQAIRDARIITGDATTGTNISKQGVGLKKRLSLKDIGRGLDYLLNDSRTAYAREVAGKMGKYLIMRLRENSARLYDSLNGHLSSNRLDNQSVYEIVKEQGGMDELLGLSTLLIKCNQLQKKIAGELKGCSIDHLFDCDLERAIRIGEHDLRNVITPPHTLASYFIRNQDSYSSEDIDELFRGLWETMVFCTSMEYLVTKDPNLLFGIPAKQVGGMKKAEEGNYDGVFDGKITNVAYLIRHQLTKNAKDVCLRHRVKDPRVKVNIYENGKDVVISVQDNALGIVDEDFNPLPTNKIVGIFGEDSYTPGGTGLGLQLVDRYVAILGGSYEVITTTGKGRIMYDSRTRQAVEERGTFPSTGSTFNITLPKDYKRAVQVPAGELVR